MNLPLIWLMFSFGAGYLQVGDQHLQYAWSHTAEPLGCSRLYWNTGVWFDPLTGWEEVFCVRKGKLRVMGWTPVGDASKFIEIRDEAGEAGQPFADLSKTSSYVVSVNGTATFGGVSLPFTDTNTWTPLPGGGWSVIETFKWVDQPDVFTSIVAHHPGGRMFFSATQIWSKDGVVGPMIAIQGGPWWVWKE